MKVITRITVLLLAVVQLIGVLSACKKTHEETEQACRETRYGLGFCQINMT